MRKPSMTLPVWLHERSICEFERAAAQQLIGTGAENRHVISPRSVRRQFRDDYVVGWVGDGVLVRSKIGAADRIDTKRHPISISIAHVGAVDETGTVGRQFGGVRDDVR